MQRARFIVNHPATHRDRVLQRFMRDADLFQCMNAPGRNRQINRSSADDVAFARISAALVKIDLVPAPPQKCGEQTTCESAANENKLCHFVKNLRIRKSGKQENRSRRFDSFG